MDIAPLCRAAYRIAPGPVRARLRVRRPPGVQQFGVTMPGGERALIWGLDQAAFVKDLFWLGFEGCNPEFTRVFYALAKGASGIIDLGSYLGYFSLVAALANRSARVYSVEPLPESVAYQTELFRRNHADVGICPVGVADFTGRTSFYVPDRSVSRIPNIGSLVNRFGAGTHYADRGSRESAAEILTLPDLCSRFAVERVDLIKFFIEEVETKVFTAGESVLRRWQPDLLGWVFYRGDNVERLGAVLSALGYSFFAFRGQSLVACPTLLDARTLGDVHGVQRGGRSAVFATTKPELRMAELSRAVPGVRPA